MAEKIELHIVIIFGGDFPIGGAYTARMHGFAKGLVENGHRVHFLVINPGCNKLSTNILRGTYENVDFVYTCHYTYKQEKKIKQLFVAILGTIGSIKELIKIQKSQPIDAIISGTNSLFRVMPIYILSRLYKIKIIREYNEYPLTELGYKKQIPFFTDLFNKIEFNLFDGMVVISKPLIDYFKNILFKNKKISKIPIIVDPSKFNKKSDEFRNNIVFVGDILGEKDGACILLDAFKLIHDKIPLQKLILIGDISKKDHFANIIKQYIDESVKDKIIFTGYIHRDKVSRLISNAKLLVLPRPANKQAKAGLPTKLGEYLSTGNPVLCTGVGDIPCYLKDGINAFLVEPNNVNALAQRMLYIFENEKISKRIGQKGKELTLKEFNYNIQSKVLADFIMRLRENHE